MKFTVSYLFSNSTVDVITTKGFCTGLGGSKQGAFLSGIISSPDKIDSLCTANGGQWSLTNSNGLNSSAASFIDFDNGLFCGNLVGANNWNTDSIIYFIKAINPNNMTPMKIDPKNFQEICTNNTFNGKFSKLNARICCLWNNDWSNQSDGWNYNAYALEGCKSGYVKYKDGECGHNYCCLYSDGEQDSTYSDGGCGSTRGVRKVPC